MIHYDSQLQYATAIITKCNSYFITKSERSLLQNVSSFLLQNAIVSLQNVTTLLQNIDFHYKLRQYNLYPLHHSKQEIHDMVYNRASWKAGEFLCSQTLILFVSYGGERCSFLPSCFNLHFFSLFKNIVRALNLSSWVENKRGTIGYIFLEQWQNNSKLRLRKMCLVLAKKKCNSTESSAGFVITFSSHLLRSSFP